MNSRQVVPTFLEAPTRILATRATSHQSPPTLVHPSPQEPPTYTQLACHQVWLQEVHSHLVPHMGNLISLRHPLPQVETLLHSSVDKHQSIVIQTLLLKISKIQQQTTLGRVMPMWQPPPEAMQEMCRVSQAVLLIISRVEEVQQVAQTSILLQTQEQPISRVLPVEQEHTNLQAHQTQACSKIQPSKAA